jgi:hypothetical protein
MPTEKPRFTITMDESLFNQIEEFKFNGRYKNQTKAVLALIEKGLSDYEIANEKESPSMGEPTPEDDGEVFRLFNALNNMLVSAGVIKADEDITAKQADVLIAICRIIDATFKD